MQFRSSYPEGVPHIISLGAGVQSTTMYLMALRGELTPRPNWAIFADTQREPEAVYKHLEFLEGVNSYMLPAEQIPIIRVTAGDLREAIVTNSEYTRANGTPDRFISIPAYVPAIRNKARDPKATASMLRRQCTREYKLAPIMKATRELLGLKPRQRTKAPVAVQWIGISLDEIQRMKESLEAWKVHRWPLVELGMTRGDCLAWLKRLGYPEPPKSACTFCPFHNDGMWQAMKLHDPKSWKEAVEVDRAIRNGYDIDGQAFLHPSLTPLEDIDFSKPKNPLQSGFDLECEGMCGV